MTHRQIEAVKRIEGSDKDPLYPADVASVIGCSPYTITVQARNNPNGFGFPVRVIGTRTQIPRYSFLKYCKEVLGYK